MQNGLQLKLYKESTEKEIKEITMNWTICNVTRNHGEFQGAIKNVPPTFLLFLLFTCIQNPHCIISC